MRIIVCAETIAEKKEMKKKLIFVVLTLCVLLASAFALSACGTKTEEKSVIGDISQDTISMRVSATADDIILNLDSDEKTAGNGVVDILEVAAYEYVSGDPIFGLSENKVAHSDSKRKIGTYKLGTDYTLTVDRFVKTQDDADGEFDRLYNKYYVVGDGRVLKGPIYATEVTAAHNAEPQLDIKSKKGLLGENVKDYAELGCSYVTLNFDIEDLIYPNEMFDESGAIPLAHPDDAIEFVSNGKTYYFNRNRVAAFDSSVKDYYALGSHVTAIIYAANRGANPEVFPSKMTYLPWATMPVDGQAPILLGLNTSNEYGYGYFVAAMEFLAERYTRDDLANGYIANYVIGNEINYPQEYNRISKYQAPLDVYMEEYSRLLRLANLAVKKYDSSISVNVPFTQAWAKKYSSSNTTVHAYTPKTMVEWLNTKTKLEGDFDWGIAPHCYTYGLALPYVFYNDTTTGVKKGMTGDFDTAYLTFSNIEVLDMYLNRPQMQFDGKTRGIWLTESGVSTYRDSEKERNIQAGAIAAIWYKVSQIDSIKSFSYYRLYDHSAEIAGGARFGLIDVNGDKKPSYEVYKYVDTQYSRLAAKDYLRYLEYKDTDGNLKNVENGGVKSYLDLLDVFDTGWLTAEYDWMLALPVVVPPIYEWDDKMDLSGVKFESANFLYDGTEKRLEVTGLPDGVQVEYDVDPVLTEVGAKEIIATFTLDGEFVGHRRATLSVGPLYTDKTVYNYGESIFVTADTKKPELKRTAWVGIYDKNAVPGNTSKGEISYFYYYPNEYNDNYLRTVRLQDFKNPDSVTETLPAGDYVIYYFVDGGYDYFYSVEVKVLEKHVQSGKVDLGGVVFESAETFYDGSEKRLEISGELPEGVTVEYIDNALTEAGNTQAVAVFKKDGAELCRRYAVLTVLPGQYDLISTDKTSYVEGEDVFVTAYAPATSLPNEWWVGLYLSSDDDYAAVGSIYYYYVKDANHVSGTAYDIRKQVANSSRAEYADLPVGKYKLVLFNTPGYTVETECEFEVTEWNVDGEAGSIATDKTEFALGEPINVTAAAGSSAYKYVAALIREQSDSVLENAIYSYVVADETHASGTAYDITKETLNEKLWYYAPLAAGKYKLTLFIINEAIDTVKVKQEILIRVGSAEQQPTVGTIYTNKARYRVGEDIYVTAYAPDGNTSWWVGLYPYAQDNLASPPSIRWYSVNDANHVSGNAYPIMKQLYTNFLYDELPVGRYKLVLFNTGGYDVQSVVEFEVASIDASDESGAVSVEKEKYEVGEAITVTATQKADSAFIYTVGLLRDGDAVKLANVVYSYRVTDDSHVSGGAYDISRETLNADKAAYGALVCGKYTVALFVSNSDGEQVLDSVCIEIIDSAENPTKLFTNKTEYVEGESIFVTAYAPQGNTSWWVGLYLADEEDYSATASIWWYYVNEKVESGEPFDISKGDKGGHAEYESIPAGSYRVVLFNTKGYTEETHLIITVAPAAAD